MTIDSDSRKKRVFLVDDHPLVREWLGNLINQQFDLEVCGQASSAPEALDAMVATRPHVAVVDLSLHLGSGIELIERIKTGLPETAVIVLSMHDEAHYIERALRAGARGYIIKREATAKVLSAIRTVVEGKTCFSEEVGRSIAQKIAQGSPLMMGSLIGTLSERESKVFQLLGRCYSTRRIAQEMQVGLKTVQTFNSRIKEKLNLSSANELLREAVRWHDSQNPE